MTTRVCISDMSASLGFCKIYRKTNFSEEIKIVKFLFLNSHSKNKSLCDTEGVLYKRLLQSTLKLANPLQCTLYAEWKKSMAHEKELP